MTGFLAAFRPAVMVFRPGVSMHSVASVTSWMVRTNQSIAAGPSSRPGPVLTSRTVAPHSNWCRACSCIHLPSRLSIALPTAPKSPFTRSLMTNMRAPSPIE